MDNKLLIGFAVFLAAFLLFPFVMQTLREDSTTAAPTPENQQEDSVRDPYRSNIPDIPPLLNAQNLVGTEWQFTVEGYTIKVTIADNGVCYATHPLMRSLMGIDYFEGRWRIDGDRVYVEARFGDQHFEENLYIAGNNLYTRRGEQIRRL